MDYQQVVNTPKCLLPKIVVRKYDTSYGIEPTHFHALEELVSAENSAWYALLLQCILDSPRKGIEADCRT